MALENSFDLVATETTLRRVLAAVVFPKDTAERLIVNVATGASVGVFQYWGNANTYPTWYSTGAGNAMDTREAHTLSTYLAIQNTISRWTIS